MQKDNLYIDIYGFSVNVEAPLDIITLLKNDFHYFVKDILVDTKLKIKSIQTEDLYAHLPSQLVASGQTQNAITYDLGDIRYNDFYGEALSVFNYKNEHATIYYKESSFLHELIYLLILSRSGKWMDLNGWHKIHACGVSLNKNLILMMPSKGGKTTSFLNLIEDEKLGLISDDTPVVDCKGNIHPFPLRVGVENKDALLNSFKYINEEDIYAFKRKYFSEKSLLGTNKFKNQISVSQDSILVVGIRSTFETPRLEKISKISMLRHLLTHMVVGIGLPMIVEYFLESTFRDHLKNMKILISRINASVKLLRRSDCYQLYTSASIEQNVTVLKELLSEG